MRRNYTTTTKYNWNKRRLLNMFLYKAVFNSGKEN